MGARGTAGSASRRRCRPGSRAQERSSKLSHETEDIIRQAAKLKTRGSAFERVIKWAMEGFSRRMALEFAAYGIRVNTLFPTFTKTPMTKP
ncbi:SDR family NAD(P)-dependent oxidoreductase [Neorhizobium sp. P12A]|uniref:SDR family oxidoreductase n=1 Tax=Neorhizobium sp. P12A TaxID=2268027 RepID=UPI0011EF4D13|nr:SDR family oxidoreductase [Neorhizobium sp. P12A]KAA0693663.1 SDR family NAD(P)-dependent oxidoreductase [Neorhizobium sp. P12A]